MFEGFAGFAVGHGFAAGAFGAFLVGGREVAGDEDRFGAASGEAVALGAGEGVEEVLDEGVQGGGVFAAGGGAGQCGAADGEGGGDGGQDAVAALAQGRGGRVLGAAPADAWVAGGAVGGGRVPGVGLLGRNDGCVG